MQLTHGSLFAGIGGFDLGFERAGMKTIWQVEIDEYCRRVLARHFPNAERFNDVRGCGANNLKWVDIICGGFPCQDISIANSKRTGLAGERSGLWSEYARIISELRPRFVVVENVAALLIPADDREIAPIATILGDLAALGYDAEWDCIPACAVGAPHLRERIWIVAYPQCQGLEGMRLSRVVLTDAPKGEIRDARLSPSDTVRKRNGIPNYMDRIHALGNAIVPQIAEWIGRRIVEGLGESR